MSEGPSGISPNSQPFSEFLRRTPAADDGASIHRLYRGGNGELRLSSNCISHAVRGLLGKPRGIDALQASLNTEFGFEGTNYLLLNVVPEGHDFGTTIASLRSFQELIKNDADEPPAAEWDDDFDMQARIWNNFEREKRGVVGESLADSQSADSVLLNPQRVQDGSVSEPG